MSASTIVTLLAIVGSLAICCPPLGRYLAAVFGVGPAPGDRIAGPIESVVHRLLGVDQHRGQRWHGYAVSVVAFSAVSTVALYVFLRVQGSLPFNPTGSAGMSPSLASNTAISFVTGTDWQAYAGETAMTHFGQMAGLVVVQFTAGAVAIAVSMALVFFAGLMTGRTPSYLGNRVRQAETKLIMLAILAVPVVVLSVSAAAVAQSSIRATTSQAGPHGLTEIIYAAASATNGNGSAMAGLNATGDWWTITLGLAMLAGRFLVFIPALALAGSFTVQPKHDTGTLDSTSRTFTPLVIAVVVILGGLTFLPVLVLSVVQAASGDDLAAATVISNLR